MLKRLEAAEKVESLFKDLVLLYGLKTGDVTPLQQEVIDQFECVLMDFVRNNMKPRDKIEHLEKTTDSGIIRNILYLLRIKMTKEFAIEINSFKDYSSMSGIDIVHELFTFGNLVYDTKDCYDNLLELKKEVESFIQLIYTPTGDLCYYDNNKDIYYDRTMNVLRDPKMI